MSLMDTWEERWEQCWPLLLGHLSARHLICLSFSSRSILVRLNSTLGWWTQACQTHLWPPTQQLGETSTAAHSPTAIPLSPAAADQQARQVLIAATALAHHVRQTRSPPPQTVQIPPWLPGQPGKSRGFSRIEDPASLDPPLLLTHTQLAWLAYGSLSGHTSGVFISTCSSSPRSHQPCAFLAAVVSNKALLAELYIPRDIAPPDPWAGLLTHTVPDTSNGGSACSSNASSSTCSSMAGTDPQSNKSSHQASSSSSAAVCAAAASVELWLSSAVQLQSPQQHAQPAAAAGGRGAGGGRAAARGGRGHRDRGGRRDTAAGDSWCDIHRFIVECIGDNASRCKAVRGTTAIPPGTPAAAAIEQQLALLAAAGGPVLDMRRLHWEAAAAAARERRRQEAEAAAAAWVRPSVRYLMEMQQQGHLQQQQQEQQQGLDGGHHHQAQQQEHQLFGGAASSGCRHHNSTSCGLPTAAANGGMSWQASTAARLHSALEDVHMERAAAAEAAATAAEAHGQQAAAGAECEVQEGDRPELLAALVEKLPGVAPDVQLLVLPVLLPGGRAAQRIPGAGGSRLSAPKLLCLNVPFLVAVRRHAWERLPRLRHVLLMVGTPPPLPPAAPPMQQASWQQQQQVQPGCAVGGVATAHASGEEGSSSGGVVAGTFTAQELEQQWQQRLQLGEAGQQQQQHQGQRQQMWEAEQDDWFAQQVTQQRPRGGQRQYAMYLEHGYDTEDLRAVGCVGGCEGGECGGDKGAGVASEAEVLPRAAVDALHDMVHSCMDRAC